MTYVIDSKRTIFSSELTLNNDAEYFPQPIKESSGIAARAYFSPHVRISADF